MNGQEEIELVVRPTREVMKKLPWFGTMSIRCNKLKKRHSNLFVSERCEGQSNDDYEKEFIDGFASFHREQHEQQQQQQQEQTTIALFVIDNTHQCQ
jgi:hypothetical protein